MNVTYHHLMGRRILVVGAGVAGLTVARCLALRGAQVTVLEQAPAITEVGARLQIGPNGMAVLRGIGLDHALRKTNAPVAKALTLRNRRGDRIARFPMAPLQRPDDYLFVHRADLIKVLEHGARDAGVSIVLNQRVTSVIPGEKPNVRYEGGTENPDIRPDIVIGADGLHSIVAQGVCGPNGRAEPFFTGHVAWRATVPETPQNPAAPHLASTDEVELYMGPGRHIVTYPLRGGQLRNIVAVEERAAWTEESWTKPDDTLALRKAFADMGDRPRALLKKVETVHIWGLFRHNVAQKWFAKNVVLLGDTVHPPLPFLAQGAGMAIEDAWVLAACLSETPNVEKAMTRYQALRYNRVEKTVKAANRNAWAYHLDGVMAFGAQTGMKVLGIVAPTQPIKAFRWLYDHDVTNGTSLV